MASVGERLLQEGRELAKEAKGSDARCDRHHKLNVPHKPARVTLWPSACQLNDLILNARLLK